MESQNSVGKRIIWAVSMVVLCTFLAFFMSMFLESVFPKMNIIYRVGIPALVFVVLGIVSLGLQNYIIPLIEGVSIPKGIKNALPVIIIGIGIVLGQCSYDEFAKTALESDIFQKFILDGQIYEMGMLSFQGIYQSGLNFVCVLLGNTVFAVSFYNRVYLVLSAILIYFAIKNIAGKHSLAGNLFLILFFCAKQTMKLAVVPDASVVYLLFVAVFLLSVSSVYYYRTKTTNIIAQVISVFVMGCLFAVLFICETNSFIFALPAIFVSFSGKQTQDKRWYYILAVEGMLLILITCAVVFVLKPELILNFVFILPAIDTANLEITTLLILNVIGFLGIYGMWNKKLYYVIPAIISMYYMFSTVEFVSGISKELCEFLFFVLYAALGVGSLQAISEETDLEEELEEDGEEDVETETEQPEMAEINTIKALNEKLNQVETGFVPMTFKKPKRQEKKTIDYAYEPTPGEMKYDVLVSDDDDFDI